MQLEKRFSAAGSALGYLAQVNYALLIALKKMDEWECFDLSLETFDDIVVHSDSQDDPTEFWQSKHHKDPDYPLNDRSPDLWKSIRNWIETSDEETLCILYTTATATHLSAPSYLYPDQNSRNINKARSILDAIAEEATNQSLQDCYKKYLSLSTELRTELLNRVIILDGQASASNIKDKLLKTLRKSVTRPNREALLERLLGWWDQRVLKHLTDVANGEKDLININEIESQIHYISQSLRDDSLPIDFQDEPEPNQSEIDEDDRTFIQQLRLINLHRDRIHHAVYDHNRAFLQRSKWLREELLLIGELDRYDQCLMEEWRRVFAPLEEPSPSATACEDNKRATARESYLRLQNKRLPEVRVNIPHSYVPYGSLHILADSLKIGWHPDWKDLVKAQKPIQFNSDNMESTE